MRKYSVIFLIGFFSLIAQTLLFREFFQIFEGNELGLSAFFSSWLFWVAAGAWLGKKIKWFFSFESMPLLFLPAYLLQYMAILYSRTWSGISFYEVFPCEKMAMISFLVNSPVSLVTGFLFTQACRDQYGRVISVAKIYLLEAIGSFTGGMLVTLALSLTFSSEQIFLAALFLLMAPIALLQREQKKYLISGLYPLLILLFLFSVAPEKLSRCHDLYFWNNILPGGHFQGRFTTKKTRYLYGEYHDQFQVLSWGKVCETLPNTQHASEITALTLSQKSNAEKVLILGESILGIGLTMAKLPSVREITLLHDDEEYFPALFKIWPSSYRESLKKIKIPGQDIRQFLSSHPDSYDLILVHFPPAPSAVINRYYTEEFNHLLKQALKKDGVAAIQFSGGENFLGEELIRIGSSLYLTLKSCFLNIILKPGEESWFIASDWKEISSSASILSERFRSIDKSGRILSPERVLSLYPRDRIDFQMKLYRDYLNNNPVLKNTDTLPHLYLFRLLVYGKQTGVLFNRLLTSLTNKGLFPFLVLILIYGIFRLIYLIKGRSQKQTAGVFDSYFLVFSTGFISLSLELILMFIYQTRFGSIFL
ncbi:MAG: hypothetical protein JW774_02940, partial [Candidatus Aureabacteria bacterium]|nr:hypothetical protein [Candidatus Auribacterota bacterium]